MDLGLKCTLRKLWPIDRPTNRPNYQPTDGLGVHREKRFWHFFGIFSFDLAGIFNLAAENLCILQYLTLRIIIIVYFNWLYHEGGVKLPPPCSTKDWCEVGAWKGEERSSSISRGPDRASRMVESVPPSPAPWRGWRGEWEVKGEEGEGRDTDRLTSSSHPPDPATQPRSIARPRNKPKCFTPRFKHTYNINLWHI